MPSNKPFGPFTCDFGRRKFISSITKTVGSTIFLTAPILSFSGNLNSSKANDAWTVGQIMDLFIKAIPEGSLQNTVDTLKAGNRDIKVTGIVTTMFATLKVIKKAIDLGANFIIAHEPTFYNHQDETDWLENDEVYLYKSDLLKKHNIAVWRNHDYIHNLNPDGVKISVAKKLGWEKYYNPDGSNIAKIPSISLKNLIRHVKEKLNVSMVRYSGDLSQTCEKILVMPGAPGGRNHINAIARHKPDVLICGEIQEWETAEYVRDAQAKGQKISLIVVGHIASEEAGSEFMADWLKDNISGVKSTCIPSGNSLSFL